MIWIDVNTPKYALFFSYFIPLLKQYVNNKIIVTTRYTEEYKEPKKILEIHNIEHIVVGEFGGESLEGKFVARIQRQLEFIKIFNEIGTPKLLISGGSVDAIQTAHGLAMQSILFSDTPIRGYEFDYNKITPLTRLIVPLSSLIFHPFLIPSQVYHFIGIAPEKVISHNFLDICLWMDKIQKNDSNDFRKKLNLDISKPTILIREEEFKAHYVNDKLTTIYQIMIQLPEEIDANIVIIPRYGDEHLKQVCSDKVVISNEKFKPEELYPFIDLLVGGGGTMNIEASYYGIPVISTRSLLLFHDKYMIENDLMKWTNDVEEVIALSKELINKKFDNKKMFCENGCGFDKIVSRIAQFMQDHNI